VICPYCGVALSKENSTKEHVLARKFVPKGTLNNQWNLILNACRCCNNSKSDLEDDISAITMQPNMRGDHFDYVGALKENQTAIYYLAGDDVARLGTSPHLEGFRARSVGCCRCPIPSTASG
jgi:hypothetical protein